MTGTGRTLTQLALAAGMLGLAAGCGAEPEPPAGTGAAEAARAFFEALLARDWQAAYDRLDPGSRARFGLERFTRLARAYRDNLGFERGEVRLRSCEEHGDGASAHVVLAGRAGGRPRSFRDGVTLRRVGDVWGVLLPDRFGQVRARPRP